MLHVFLGHTYGDGSWLQGGLVMDSAGNLYGSTGYGGTGNCVVVGTYPGCGTAYELSPPAQKGGAWTETVLYSFQGGKDGFVPLGDLLLDRAGNLYGATIFGGGHGTDCGDAFYQYCGTIYELSPPQKQGGAWTEQVLYSFKGLPYGAATYGDGAWPNGGLVMDNAGAIYGTTQIGGLNCPHRSNAGCGTVFKLTPPQNAGAPWSENILYRFPGIEAGETPLCGLTSDKKGDLYGTTELGGTAQPNQEGTIFELTRREHGDFTYSILHSFSGLDEGGEPEASPAFDAEGNLYGSAGEGGTGLQGTVYELSPGSRATTSIPVDVLYDFGGKPNGAFPHGELTFDQSGDVLGTTQYGGTSTACSNYGCGIVFEIVGVSKSN